MKNNLHIFSDTLLKRQQNTLYFQTIINDEEDEDKQLYKEEFFNCKNSLIPTGDRKYIPVESVDSIFAVGNINFNSRFLYFLSQNRIPLHSFSLKGNYAGSFIPADRQVSGDILLKQTEYFKNYTQRMYIAREIITASANNMLANIKYYQSRGRYLSDHIEQIEELLFNIDDSETINEIMGFEGQIRRTYYNSWQQIFTYPIDFYRRVKNPPDNMINALISYGNMIVYGTVINEIYKTRIYPEIGFVHEPGDSKLPLVYDIADIFKPLITDRTIFKLINKNIISSKQFFTKNGFCRINKKAKQIFAREIEDKLYTKISIDSSSKRLSYKSIIREEFYKLIKHFNNEMEYKAFRTKW